MDKSLREQHVARLGDDRYIAMYDGLCAEVERRGELTSAAQGIVADICYLEQTKALLAADINERGVNKIAYNGRQHYLQSNKSVGEYKGCCEQQRKMYSELRLTPASSGVRQADVMQDDFNSF